VNKNEESFLKYFVFKMESSNLIIQQKCAEVAKVSQFFFWYPTLMGKVKCEFIYS
jgi:hypothetical protein